VTSVIVLYVKPMNPVLGVLLPVGPVSVPTLPSGRTFVLPLGAARTPVQFPSDELVAVEVDTAETDPLALFGYGIELQAHPPGPDQPALVPVVTGGITIDAPADPTPTEGGTIKGNVMTGQSTGPLDVELWAHDGRVAAIRVQRTPPQTGFQFAALEPATYVVLAAGFVPEKVIVPARKIL
jgi:hypothetical protein